MIRQIKILLAAVPFVPFKIRTSDGREYVVPTRDHASVSPNNGGIIIYDDNDLFTALSGLHIASVEGANLVA